MKPGGSDGHSLHRFFTADRPKAWAIRRKKRTLVYRPEGASELRWRPDSSCRSQWDGSHRSTLVFAQNLEAGSVGASCEIPSRAGRVVSAGRPAKPASRTEGSVSSRFGGVPGHMMREIRNCVVSAHFAP